MLHRKLMLRQKEFILPSWPSSMVVCALPMSRDNRGAVVFPRVVVASTRAYRVGQGAWSAVVIKIFLDRDQAWCLIQQMERAARHTCKVGHGVALAVKAIWNFKAWKESMSFKRKSVLCAVIQPQNWKWLFLFLVQLSLYIGHDNAKGKTWGKHELI